MEYSDKQYAQERALYGITDAIITNCKFDGIEDGESPLKECKDIVVNNSYFNLRYPLWHVKKALVQNSEFTEKSRAGFWYDKDITVIGSKLHGIKAFRECQAVTIENCDILSPEFGWKSKDMNISNCKIEGEYPFFETSDLMLYGVKLKGKYSFQYVKDMQIKNCNLDTKDAFWHSKDVTVIDSIVKGEYLGWYSENLKFINCTITGTQPLCYAKNLILDNCTMIDTDLAFERSEVKAKIKGNILSIKNPISGSIQADKIGQIIIEEKIVDKSKTQIIELNK